MFTAPVGGRGTIERQAAKEEEWMPEIIVFTRSSRTRDRTILHQERVSARDLESEHFAAQLIERLGWALSDADEIETTVPVTDPTLPGPQHHDSRELELRPGAARRAELAAVHAVARELRLRPMARPE
jgi:hypothetical protein